MTYDEVLRWAMNDGVAVVMLLAGCFAFWKSAGWFANKIVIPLRDAAVAHIVKVGEAMQSMSTAIDRLGKTMDTVSERLNHVDSKADVILSEHKGFMEETIKDRKALHRKIENVEREVAKLEEFDSVGSHESSH